MPRSGVADLPLHGGHCPPWLFRRMTKLAAAILEAIVLEYGAAEVLRRVADPYWFQALGCVLGFDWHSSGLTTTVCGAMKVALAERGPELGLFIAGGKGATSRRTPREIEEAADRYALPLDPARLARASRMAAKVDTAALQDGYTLYHHVFFFTADGQWAVVQQGMQETGRWARRYHWLGSQVRSFVDEPHAAVCSDRTGPVLNMVDAASSGARATIAALAREHPERVLRDYRRVLEWMDSATGRQAAAAARAAVVWSRAPVQLSLFAAPGEEAVTAPGEEAAAAEEGFIPHDVGPPEGLARYLALPAPHAIPDAGRLDRALRQVYEQGAATFEQLLGMPGVGAQTIRALAMVAEVVHGAPASFRDPVRYSFAHGGKDGHPYPVRRPLYDRSLATLQEAVERARVGDREKMEALRRLSRLAGGA